MATGLQIFDGAGRPILDAKSRAGRVVGIAWAGGSDGSVAADMSGGEPFWAFMPQQIFVRVSGAEPSPVVSINAGESVGRIARTRADRTRTPESPGGSFLECIDAGGISGIH